MATTTSDDGVFPPHTSGPDTRPKWGENSAFSPSDLLTVAGGAFTSAGAAAATKPALPAALDPGNWTTEEKIAVGIGVGVLALGLAAWATSR